MVVQFKQCDALTTFKTTKNEKYLEGIFARIWWSYRILPLIRPFLVLSIPAVFGVDMNVLCRLFFYQCSACLCLSNKIPNVK